MLLHWRTRALERLASETFDVLVVGGGITGAGVARDAALRGLRVALCERDDFASGTSSRSSRLVHGGVRYLEHGHLHLVFESSRERRILLRMAPHLVRPLAFTWPVYRRARVPRWKLWAGLALYDALALFRNVDKHRRLSTSDVALAEPGLRRDGLVGGARYFDASTDDTRLTLANALDAADSMAVVLNHVEFEQLDQWGRSPTPTSGRVAVVRDRLTNTTIRVQTRVVVNATGPWSDTLRTRLSGSSSSGVLGSVGAHVAVSCGRIGNRGAVTLLSPLDGRVMFVLPAGKNTIIGTTETPSKTSPDTVRATDNDVEYLLAAANTFFPDAKLDARDVISAWAGIRPLASSLVAKDAGSASREHLIARDTAGVLSVSGGKLTTYRSMAAEVVDAVERELGVAHKETVTGRVPIRGGDFGSFERELESALAVVHREDVASRLVRAYGSDWPSVWRLVEEDRTLADRLSGDQPYLRAEVVYGVIAERACTVADVLVRRTHLAFELRDHGWEVAPAVAGLMAPLLGWDASAVQREIDRYAAEVARVFTIVEE
jgi:glycerol-3-phosphate dehydrogenase